MYYYIFIVFVLVVAIIQLNSKVLVQAGLVILVLGLIALFAYDTYLKPEHCSENHIKSESNEDESICALVNSINQDDELNDELNDKINDKLVIVPSSPHDIDIHQGNKSIKEMHHYMGCDGDNRIANRMKYMSIQPQVSDHIRANYNKYALQPFLEEELRENETRHWWENDALESEF